MERSPLRLQMVLAACVDFCLEHTAQPDPVSSWGTEKSADAPFLHCAAEIRLSDGHPASLPPALLGVRRDVENPGWEPATATTSDDA